MTGKHCDLGSQSTLQLIRILHVRSIRPLHALNIYEDARQTRQPT